MKKLLLVLSIASLCQAGTLGPVCSSATVTAPGVMNCTIALIGGGSLSSILGATLATSQPTGPPTFSIAGVGATANKTVSASGNGFILWGNLNNTPIPDGAVASVSFAVPANTPAFTISLTGIAGASPAGGPVAITPGAPVSVSITGAPPPVLSPCDLDKNGVTNAQDVSSAIGKYLASPPGIIFLSTATVADVQAVLMAALGLGCSVVAPPPQPPPPPVPPLTVSLASLVCAPATLLHGASSTCAVTLSGPAPTGSAAVSLSRFGEIFVPASVTVAAGSTSANFTASSITVLAAQPASVTASYNGVTQTANLTLGP